MTLNSKILVSLVMLLNYQLSTIKRNPLFMSGKH